MLSCKSHCNLVLHFRVHIASTDISTLCPLHDIPVLCPFIPSVHLLCTPMYPPQHSCSMPLKSIHVLYNSMAFLFCTLSYGISVPCTPLCSAYTSLCTPPHTPPCICLCTPLHHPCMHPSVSIWIPVHAPVHIPPCTSLHMCIPVYIALLLVLSRILID